MGLGFRVFGVHLVPEKGNSEVLAELQNRLRLLVKSV